MASESQESTIWDTAREILSSDLPLAYIRSSAEQKGGRELEVELQTEVCARFLVFAHRRAEILLERGQDPILGMFVMGCFHGLAMGLRRTQELELERLATAEAGGESCS